jgi:hypothetical protein
VRSERALPLGAIAVATLAPAVARLRPSRLVRVLTLATRRSARDVRANAVTNVERALGIVGRVRPQSCLTRGITRFVLLRRAGIPVELVFGVCASAGNEGGHCWLEVDGEPYLETTDPREAFPEVFRVPARTVAA